MLTFDQLIRDPWEKPDFRFRRILGNIGKPETTILVPPKLPMIKSIDPGSWRAVNHFRFNNRPEDHFKGTSLHVSFTNFTQPVDMDVRGEQGTRVSIVETIVSVHDRGKWIADIDVVKGLSHDETKRLTRRKGDGDTPMHTSDSCPKQNRLLSLENWDELLDLPHEIAVVRGRNNPLARLATAVVLTQLRTREKNSDGRPRMIWICPPVEEMCLSCAYERLRGIHQEKFRGDHIFIY